MLEMGKTQTAPTRSTLPFANLGAANTESEEQNIQPRGRLSSFDSEQHRIRLYAKYA